MKPMLAATVKDIADLRFPLLASPKIDGVRAIVRGGCVLSRSLKPIPNYTVQEAFKHLEGFDGELVVGSAKAKDVYRTTVSGVMSQSGSPAVRFMVFDDFREPNTPYQARIREIPEIFALPQAWLKTPAELIGCEEQMLAEGFEGLILRDPGGRYKYGRSTLAEHGMLKLKRFLDDEAVIIGFEELYSNQNEAKRNALGHIERSSHQENQVPMGKLGALVCLWQEKQFKIGTGFTDAERVRIWEGREGYVGKTVKFKYLPIGVKDLPRHPVFLGWRHEIDAS